VSRARLAARARTLLGPVHGPVAIVMPHAPRLADALATTLSPAEGATAAAAAVVAFLGDGAGPAERQTLLRSLATRLPVGAPLVLLDHNQPRAWWRRAVGTVRLAAGGFRPARARYPAARELAVLGFGVEQLRLECGERVQLVLARRQ
jgi:energy-converting hydrogenase Eha subunit E